MAYTKTNWQDLPNTSTPINATNLNKIENELESVDKSLKYIGNAPTDWNDAKTFGIYNVSGTYTNAPTSSQIWGVLIVYENRGSVWNPGTPSGSWIWQEFRDTSGKIYRRNATNTSNSWTSWRLDEPIKMKVLDGATLNSNGNITTDIVKSKYAILSVDSNAGTILCTPFTYDGSDYWVLHFYKIADGSAASNSQINNVKIYYTEI